MATSDSSHKAGLLTQCLPVTRPPSSGKKLQKNHLQRSSQSTTSLTSRFSIEPLKRTFSKRRTADFSNETPGSNKTAPSIRSGIVATTDNGQQVEYEWHGGTKPTLWGGFSKDDSLWLPDENCLVFFEEVHMRSPPTPYFRLDTNKISASGIPFLEALVAAAKLRPTERTTRRYGAGATLSPVQQKLRRRSLNLLPMVKTFSPLKLPQMEQESDAPNKRQSWHEKRKTWMGNDNRWSQYLQTGIAPAQHLATETIEHTLDLWIAIPEDDPAQAHRRKLAIRNVFAMLHLKPLVGSDFLQMLHDLREVLVLFCSTPGKMAACQALDVLLGFLAAVGFDDVRHDSDQAMKMLAWSESPNVKWVDGYLESFVHVVGMSWRTSSILDSLIVQTLSKETQIALRHAHSAMQTQVAWAERMLSSFDFTEMWTLSKIGSVPARKAFDAFRNFLLRFWEERCRSWPPPPTNHTERWFNRSLIIKLHAFFGPLYDYLVDTTVEWEQLRAVYRREWEMVSHDGRFFQADMKRVPITDMLVRFDESHGFRHMKDPYPLLPTSENMPKLRTSGSSLFASFKRAAVGSGEDMLDKIEKSNAYSAATNIRQTTEVRAAKDLPASFLITAFEEHERDTYIPDCTLEEARLGRWILLYGIMQTLDMLHSEPDGLKHKHDVRYFLCASLEGCPLWVNPTQIAEATRDQSYLQTVLARMDEAESREKEQKAGAASQQAAQVRKERNFAIRRKPLPPTPPRLSRQVTPKTMVPASSITTQQSPSKIITPTKHERVVSSATADSAWTDIDMTSTARPSMSTIREGDAEFIPVRRGKLTEIRGRPRYRENSIRRQSSGFMEHFDEEEKECGEPQQKDRVAEGMAILITS